jgi:hypothetical protein
LAQAVQSLPSQVQGPTFKYQYCQKKRQRKKENENHCSSREEKERSFSPQTEPKAEK